MLRQLRAVIRDKAPQAEEKISYGMPYYGFRGRLAYFAAFRDHVSFFVMGGAQHRFRADSAPYRSGRATLRFPLGTKIPVRLIERIVRFRLQELRTVRR